LGDTGILSRRYIMQVLGPNELMQDVVDRGLCIGCGACVNLCPYFKNYMGKTGQIFPCTLAQGRCYAFCPKAEVDLGELSEGVLGLPYDGSPLGNYQEIVSARAGKQIAGGTFQAGGTVSSLVSFALASGFIDSAVLTGREGLIPVPRIVTTAEEVVACASSKYTAAPTLAALNEAVNTGYSRIGVVGTPCQITATAKMRSNPLQREDFADPIGLTVGLFCTWALDTRSLIAFLAKRMDISTIKAMDIPPPPSEILIVKTGNDEVRIPLGEIRPLIPRSCTVCPDMTSEWSDISVGVLEGRPEWNTLIIRTRSGKDIVDHALREGYLVTEEMPPDGISHLQEAALNKKKRALKKAKEEGLLNTADGGTRSLLRVASDIIKRISGK
jgi:coenzyme F420 hydrogenase subunit beta